MVDNDNTSEASGASGHQFQREYDELVEALISILMIRKSANEFDVTAFITGKLPSNATSAQMNSYLLDRIISYRGLERNEAFAAFCEDFEGWTKEAFAMTHKEIRRAVRHELRIKELYTGPSRDPTDNQLAALVKAEDLLEWDRKDLFSIAAAPNSPIGLLQQRVRDGDCPVNRQATITTPLFSEGKEGVVELGGRTPQVQGRDHPVTLLSDSLGYTQHRFFQTHQPSQTSPPTQEYPYQQATKISPYTKIPPSSYPNKPGNQQLASVFAKIWKLSDDYTGNVYDVLDDKVRYFLRICYSLDILYDQFAAVFPAILSGRARHYFLHKVPFESTL
jgi:hypothetical protein